MYHCHVHFCLTGSSCGVFEIIKDMSPLEHFTHEFVHSENIESLSEVQADVILAYPRQPKDREELKKLMSGRSGETQLILIADRDQADGLGEFLAWAKDLWIMPMSDDEIQFRFIRWQQAYKVEKDLWESRQYLMIR